MSNPSSNHFQFSCPSCLRAIKASHKAAGKTLPCPGCGTPMTIPTLEESGIPVAKVLPPEGEYALETPAQRERYVPTVLSAVPEPSELDMEVYAPRKSSSSAGSPPKRSGSSDTSLDPPELPPYPMFTGIFSMFEDEAAMKWLMVLALCLSLPMILPVVVVYAFPLVCINLLALVFFCFGLWILCGVLFLAIASSCFIAILRDSAKGKESIESWPTKKSKGYIAGFFLFFLALGLSIGSGLLLESLSPYGSGYGLIFLGVCFFTFPLFLVFFLEAGSFWKPVSSNLPSSFIDCFPTWATFYFEAALLWIIGLATLSALLLLFMTSPLLTLVCTFMLGALFTFFTFLYFRLLGRLVWICDNKSRSTRRRRM